ncbi:hypothetical protein FRC07_010246 [Ceratobasidium sp. 392]|nr:hypothetical protein FRC07_010246 [Ceratobasidium sp. 392]
MSDLDVSILFQTQALSLTPDMEIEKTEILGEHEDYEQSITCYRQAAQSQVGYPTTKFSAARFWARLSSASSLEGYEAMMSLLPQVFWVGDPKTSYYGFEFDLADNTTEVVAAAIASKSYGLALE